MLEPVWFALWGLLWAVYLALDGFSLGVGLVAPLVARGEAERGRALRTIAPFWDANEVWLVAAGGVTFAAFPGAYAAIFSTLYAPLMLVLFGLIARGAGLEFRGKHAADGWRRGFDLLFFAGSATTALALGLTFANLFRGVPLDASGRLSGGLPALLGPYALAGALLFGVLFAAHGAIWLALKTDGPLQARSAALAAALWPAAVALVLAFVALSAAWTPMFANARAFPALFLLPALAALSLLAVRPALARGAYWTAWGLSGAATALLAATGVAGLWPALLRSTLDPAATVTVAGAASSPPTLKLMLAVILVLVPLIVAYQTWAYTVFRGKVAARPDPYAGY